MSKKKPQDLGVTSMAFEASVPVPRTAEMEIPYDMLAKMLRLPEGVKITSIDGGLGRCYVELSGHILPDAKKVNAVYTFQEITDVKFAGFTRA